MTASSWPAPLTGVVESVIATRQADGTWNQAALGLQGSSAHAAAEPVTARTWGETRTSRNLSRTGQGVVQFVDEPRTFVRAALGIEETSEPVTDGAAAWTRVAADRVDHGHTEGTDWVDWELQPRGTEVRRRVVPRFRRGTAAVVELTVAASRLEVPTYDASRLRDRMAYFADVVERCGGPEELQALALIEDLSAWERPSGSAEGDPSGVA